MDKAEEPPHSYWSEVCAKTVLTNDLDWLKTLMLPLHVF